MNIGADFRKGIKAMDERDARQAAAKAKGAEKPAPIPNGPNGKSSAAGIVPLPNDLINEQDNYFIQQLMRQKPSPNG